jgi:hypothetical protein
MHAKVGVAQTRANGSFMMNASAGSFLSQLSKLVLGSACFIATIGVTSYAVNSAKSAIFKDTVSISPHLLTLFTGANNVRPSLDVNKVQIIPTTSVVTSEKALSQEISLGLKRIAALDRVAKQRHRTLLRRAIVVARKPTITPHFKDVAFQIQHDRIQVTQSALQRRPAAALAVTMTEAEKLKSVQASLVTQFYVAMSEAPKAATMVADTQGISMVLTRAKAALIDTAPRIPHQTPALLKKNTPAPQHKVVAPVLVAKKTEEPVQLNKADVRSVFILGNPSSAMNTQMVTQKVAENDLAKVDHPDAPPQRLEKVRTYSPPPIPMILANLDQKPTALIQAAPVDDGKQPAVAQMAAVGRSLWSGYPKPAPAAVSAGYSTHGVSSTPTSVSTLPAVIVNTPARPPQPLKPLTDTVATSSSSSSQPPHPAFAPLLDNSQQWTFSEALNWTEPVSNPKVEILSRETQTNGDQLGWRLARAPYHWTTLFWSSSTKQEVPMLSPSTAKMLATKAGTSLQTTAGIVLAKVPAGWTLEFSGRAERALVFDDSSHLLSSTTAEGERYYVLLNASPGEQILYLNRGGESGSLAVPVLGGVMIYADLTQMERRTINGRVMEVADAAPRGVPGIHIQVVGSNAGAVTAAKGTFKIENVITFGDQNIYLETETQKNFPHRYKLSPSSLSQLTLFQMGESQVHDWIGQLEGGVSTESGLIVGALPTLAAQSEDRKPQVEVRSFAVNPTLTPETYTLSATGQLLVKSPLTAVHARFMSVQVPEGPALVQVVDKDGRLIWSEITVISPRVLTIVGPY